MPLVYSQDFKDESSLKDMLFTDPGIWKWGKSEDGTGYMEHSGRQSKYKYKVRSPYNIGLVKAVKVRSFILEAELKQVGREYGHRDMCVFYGVKDRSHFYYTHIASVMDKHANNCFIVNNAPRTNISTTTNPGHKWGDKWHKLRVVRDVDKGKTEIYLNNMDKPVMTANDKTFDWGHVGFGSFDDEGRIRSIRIWSKESKPVTNMPDLFAEGRGAGKKK
jgi:hypothetical protein